jgi:hypothetical protein
MSELASDALCVEHETRRLVMKARMTRLSRRSLSRTLAVPTALCRRRAARGGQPGAPAWVRGARPDIIELILAYSERIHGLRKDGQAAARCSRLLALADALTEAHLVTFDPMIVRGFYYHTSSVLLEPGPVGSEPRWLVRSAGRIPGRSSSDHPTGQRPARSSQARGADPDTGAYAFGHRRAVTDVAAAVLARRIRFDEETTGSGHRSCENCRRRTIERHGIGSGAASRGDLRRAGGHPDR